MDFDKIQEEALQSLHALFAELDTPHSETSEATPHSGPRSGTPEAATTAHAAAVAALVVCSATSEAATQTNSTR